MRKIFFWLLFSVPAFAQGAFYSFPVPLPGATFRVCQVGTQNPCASPVTIYSDQAMSTPIPQPVQTGVTGQFGFFLPGGQYTIQIAQPYNFVYTINIGGGGGGGGSVSTFSSGNLNPVFSTSVGTASTTPAQTFTLLPAGAHKWFGNNTGGSATPDFFSIGAGDLPFTYSGSTTQIGTTSGSLTNGHCVQIDASGNLVDSGGLCGGGATPSGPTNSIQKNTGGALGPANTSLATAGNLNSIRYVTADYNWSQSPAGTISVGANTVNLTPCPAGILVSYGFTSTPWTQVYVSTVGTPETAIITATTCTQAGGANGTITFTAANAHGAGFTVGSASAGAQEAINASMQTVVDSTILQTGITIHSPGDRVWQGRVTIMSNGGDFTFSGPVTCAMSDTCLFVGDSANSGRVSNVTIRKFAPRAGVVNGNFPALEINAQHTHVFDMNPERSLTANVSFGSYITVDDDQAFELDGMSNPQSGSWAHCSTDFCTVLIKTGTGAAVGHLSHINFTGACLANGIDWQSGNTLRIEDSVIQAYAQFAERVHGAFTANPSVKLENVYHEVANCSQTNPLGIGVAGLVADATVSISGGVGPLGALQRFANTGGTQYNYYIVVHGNVHGASAPFLAGMASTNGAGNITVKWLQIGEDATNTYDVIRTSGAANNPAPYTANCGGGTPTTCGSVALALTTGAACAAVGSTNICSFVDNAAANTASYTVTMPGVYWTALYNPTNSGTWPGGTIYSQPHDQTGASPSIHGITFDACCDNTANSQVFPVSQLVSQFGANIPVFNAVQCGGVSGGYIVVCLNNENVSSNGPTFLRTTAYNAADPPSKKGRLIFNNTQNSIDRFDLITLVDNTPALTIATTGPAAWDPGDMAISQDATAGPTSTNILVFRSANNIRSYINAVPDGSSWLEDLSATTKTFRVPITTNSQVTSTLGTGTAPLVIASTTPVANLTVSNHPTFQDCGTTTTCANTQKTAATEVIGRVSFPTATTVTVTSLPFTSATSYNCVAQDVTTAAGVINATTYTSGASVTFTETGGVNTDAIRYQCSGF